MPQTPERPGDVFDARGRGLQHHGLRRANARAVMTVVALHPGLSNAEISRRSGLSPQTVSAILLELEKAGMIARGAALRGRRGQPATPIFLDPEGAFGVGCEIGWRHLEIVLIDMGANVIAHVREDYAYPDARVLPGRIADLVSDLLAPLSPERRARTKSLGIAMPTEIWRNMHLVAAPSGQAALWREVDLEAGLGGTTGLEVSIFNDGNAACWAELIASPPPRPTDFVYFLVSRYIAAGIVGEGNLWEGPSGNSANLGSILVDQGAGPPRFVHFVASITALEERLVEAGRMVPPGPPALWDWAGLEPVVGEWIEAGAEALARAIFNAAAVIESGLAIIDGIMPPEVVARLVERTRHHLASLPPAPFVPPLIGPGRLGALAPAVGAAELTLYRRHFSRTPADMLG